MRTAKDVIDALPPERQLAIAERALELAKEVQPDEIKMWVAVRQDIDWSSHLGKLANQAGHGFLIAFLEAAKLRPDIVQDYVSSSGHAKISVRAKNEDELLRIEREAKEAGIPVALITDAARTVFPEPTRTVCAFGPARRSELPPYLRRLRLM